MSIPAQAPLAPCRRPRKIRNKSAFSDVSLKHRTHSQPSVAPQPCDNLSLDYEHTTPSPGPKKGLTVVRADGLSISRYYPDFNGVLIIGVLSVGRTGWKELVIVNLNASYEIFDS